MKLTIVIVFVLLIILQFSNASSADFVSVKNQHPLFINTLYFSSCSPKTIKDSKNEFSSIFSYSSIYINESNENYQCAFDLELASLNLSLTRGLPYDSEIKIEAPIIFEWQGFLDNFLIDYHKMLNLPDYGREFGQRNRFSWILLDKNTGKNLVNAANGSAGLGDISLFYKKLIMDQGFLGINSSYVLGLKIPSGLPLNGFGSGSFDMGCELLINKDFDWLSVNAGFGKVWLGPYLGNYTLTLASADTGFIQTEFPLFKKELKAAVQIESQAPSLAYTGLEHFKNPSVILTGGLTYKIDKDKTLEISFSEDIKAAASAPDFALNLGIIN